MSKIRKITILIVIFIFTLVTTFGTVWGFVVATTYRVSTNHDSDLMTVMVRVGERLEIGEVLSRKSRKPLQNVETKVYVELITGNNNNTPPSNLENTVVLDKTALVGKRAGYYSVIVQLFYRANLPWSERVLDTVYRANVFVTDTDYREYKPVTCYEDFAAYTATDSLILARDIVIDGRNTNSAYALFAEEFNGRLVNPHGYTITMKNSRRFVSLFREVGSQGLVDGLIVKGADFQGRKFDEHDNPIGNDAFIVWDHCAGIALNCKGLIQNCQVIGSLRAPSAGGIVVNHYGSGMIVRSSFTGNVAADQYTHLVENISLQNFIQCQEFITLEPYN